MASILKSSFCRATCFGAGTWFRTKSKSAARSLRGPSSAWSAQPERPEAYKCGKSSWSSFASRAANKSKHSSKARSGSASGLSTLLSTTMGRNPSAKALAVTNLVCGMGPSAASTSSTTPSTILKMRSTSPPKSAWPGVSTILIRVPFHSTEVALARIVIPRSRSRSLLSIARSATA